MKFVIPYHITDEDYIAFNDHHLRCTPFGRKVVRNSRIALVSFSLLWVGAFWLCLRDTAVLIVQAIAVGILCGLWMIFWRRAMLKTIRRRVRRSHKTGQERFSPRGELTVDFEAGTLIDKSEKMTLEFLFSAVQAFYETDTACYIYIQPQGGIIVPNHVFLKTDELLAFREHARNAFQK